MAWEKVQEQSSGWTPVDEGPGIANPITQNFANSPTWSDKLLGKESDEPLDLKNVPAVASTVGRSILDALEGFSSGVAGTVFKGGELVRRGLDNRLTRAVAHEVGVELPQQSHPINDPAVQRAMATPPTVSGALGKAGEQLLESYGGSRIAGGLTMGLTRGMGAVPRVITGAMQIGRAHV